MVEAPTAAAKTAATARVWPEGAPVVPPHGRKQAEHAGAADKPCYADGRGYLRLQSYADPGEPGVLQSPCNKIRAGVDKGLPSGFAGRFVVPVYKGKDAPTRQPDL